jgi:hypothetical protein
MSTESEVDGQTPLVFVQTIVLVPVVRPLTVDVFEFGSANVPPPAITDHVATPIEGEEAFRFALVVVKQNA